MLRLFTKHPAENGKTWWEHAVFAASISFRMAKSSCWFMLHGLMPFIPMPSHCNLESMSDFLLEKNKQVEKN